MSGQEHPGLKNGIRQPDHEISKAIITKLITYDIVQLEISLKFHIKGFNLFFQQIPDTYKFKLLLKQILIQLKMILKLCNLKFLAKLRRDISGN